MNAHKLYSEVLNYYFDREEITFHNIENNVIFIECYYKYLNAYTLFEFDLNKMLYTEVYNDSKGISQKNLMIFIADNQKYWDKKFIKLTSKLKKL